MGRRSLRAQEQQTINFMGQMPGHEKRPALDQTKKDAFARGVKCTRRPKSSHLWQVGRVERLLSRQSYQKCQILIYIHTWMPISVLYA